MHRFAFILTLVLPLNACISGGSGQGRVPAAEDDVMISVENQNFLDVRVYWVLTGGAERRLGVVNGNSNGQFNIRWERGELQVRFDFIGGGDVMTVPLQIQPGSIVQFRIDTRGQYYVLRQ